MPGGGTAPWARAAMAWPADGAAAGEGMAWARQCLAREFAELRGAKAVLRVPASSQVCLPRVVSGDLPPEQLHAASRAQKQSGSWHGQV